ncbi:MAG TPA: hypothetical protein H9685_05245 [Firmicutes bacterium]|nr:hypothetical protein [Bacillota bacterium]
MQYLLTVSPKYGIGFMDEDNRVVTLKDDLHLGKAASEKLIKLLNDNNCELIHFDNVLEDFYYEEFDCAQTADAHDSEIN